MNGQPSGATRRFFAAVLAGAILCAGSAAAGTRTRLVVFGDSLSDPGNFFVAFQETSTAPFMPLPDYPYGIGGHHFSNGPTWIEYAADALDAETGGAPALLRPRIDTNYAVGRARARANAPAFATYDLTTQVGLFLGDFHGRAPSDATYVVWIGANDLDDALSALLVDPTGATSAGIIQQALAAVAGNIQALWSAGARTFFVPSIPNLALTPYVRSFGPQGEGAATQLSAVYDAALGQVLDGLSVLPQSRFIRFDPGAVLSQIVAQPAAYGLSVVDASCLQFYVVQNAVCATPNTYLFWDGIHPTTRAHALIARAALRSLAGNR